MNIVNNSHCELVYVEGGTWAGTFGARRPGCASAAACDERTSLADASELLGADPCASAAPPLPALPSPECSPSGSPPLRELWVGVPLGIAPAHAAQVRRTLGPPPRGSRAPVRTLRGAAHQAPARGRRHGAGCVLTLAQRWLQTAPATQERARYTPRAFSATGARFPKETVVEDAALVPPMQIAAGATRCCSMGALVLIGAGATSTVVALGSAHDLRLRDIGAVTLEVTTQDAVSAARDAVSLTALACVNPGLCATDPTPFGLFVRSCRAEPCAAPDEPPEPAAGTHDVH